ncbi:MAG: ABC transporter permease [Bacteroidales bacterium]
MNTNYIYKIYHIISREYLTRVRKKSFIVMSILGPVLMAAMIIVPAILASMESDKLKTVAIADYSGKYKNSFKEKENLKFEYIDVNKVEELKKTFSKSGYYALLLIPDSSKSTEIQLLSDEQPDMNTKMYISGQMEGKIRSEKLRALGFDEEKLNKINPSVNIKTIKIKDDGSEEISSTEIIMAIGFIAALVIYMFIFIYGAQVMRGVIEEKTSRVVEVLISSVKPFQLMMGKIVGIAMVALTQFALWIVLTTVIVGIISPIIGMDKVKQDTSQQYLKNNQIQEEIKKAEGNNTFIDEALATLSNFPIGLMIFSFLFYFIGGYLLYGSLFAAIGGAVDNETDTQQFMLPITIPLIMSIVLAQVIIQDPTGSVAFWFSIIPFTSPVIMLIRIPFGVPAWEIALSMIILVVTFIGTTWVAAKIYRIGILMYGKKVTYKELWKWLKYND